MRHPPPAMPNGAVVWMATIADSPDSASRKNETCS